MKHPQKDAEVVVEFVADNSVESRLIGGGGRGFWAHMTQHVAPGMVIDARLDAMTIAKLDPGVEPDTQHWQRLLDGAWHIPAGVQRRPAAYLLANPYSLTLAMSCTQAARADFLAALESQVGQRYDVPGIWDRVFNRLIDPNWRGKHHPFFCNALGIWALQKKAKIVRPLMEPPYGRTPGAACDACMATEGSRVVQFRGDAIETFLKMAGFDVTAIPH